MFYPLYNSILFQSTLPARGATKKSHCIYTVHSISIHTPREGSDNYDPVVKNFQHHFNPHSPRGERPERDANCGRQHHFNPHSPRGERQNSARVMLETEQFQSTLPARGATRDGAGLSLRLHHFNPHSPRGERQFTAATEVSKSLFQSTLPARGATAMPPASFM